MATRYFILPYPFAPGTPNYWKTEAWQQTLKAGDTTIIALQYGADFPSVVGDILDIDGAKGKAQFQILGFWKGGFDYAGGKVKTGHFIFSLKCITPASVGHAGYAVRGLVGASMTVFVSVKDATMQGAKPADNPKPPDGKDTTPPAKKEADGFVESTYAIANFFERMLPVALIGGVAFLIFRLFFWKK